MLRIISMLRIRNEARWIAEVLESLHPVATEIHVFDDHSDDGTPDICERLGATVYHSPFQGLDETRDKNYLLRKVDLCSPDFVLCTDGDEILDSATYPALTAAVSDCHFSSFSFRVLYLWNDRHTVRKDGVYGNFWRPSIFRWFPKLTFRSTSAGGNFHCGNIPSNLNGASPKVAVNLLHLGYMLPEDRKRKFAWYNSMDPSNTFEDNYRHMVQGDVPTVPADMRLRHGGPLLLEAI